MKNFNKFFIFFAVVIIIFGCSKNDNLTDPVTPTIPPSAAGILATRVISSNGTSQTFETDIFAVDGTGKFISGLSSSSFSIDNTYFRDYQNGYPTGDSTYYQFAQSSFSNGSTQAFGPYSATLLFDQSGSIASTDPNNKRLEAAKTFLSAVGQTDYVLVSAFASGGKLPYDITYWTSFTHDGTSYNTTIDYLANKIGGGTPLYKAIEAMTQFTADSAKTANKALIVFTDGDDTDGGYTVSDVISYANSKNVRIFTVGLGSSISSSAIGKIANATGGAFMKTPDATRLMALYGSLGNILRGNAPYYRLRWTANRSKSNFSSGNSFNTSVQVTFPDNSVMYTPIYVETP